MSSTTIHALAYKVIMDNSDFTEGAQLNRSELRESKKLMEESRTPLQKLEDEYKKLAKMAATGAIDQKVYNEQIELARQAYVEAEVASGDFGESVSNTSDYLEAMDETASGSTGSITSFKIGLGMVVGVAGSVVGGLIKIQDKIKDLRSDLVEFQRFGLDVEDFGTFRVLAAQKGLQVDNLLDLQKDLRIRIGEAFKEEGEPRDLMAQLGIDVDSLKDASSLDQIRAFADAIQDIKSETEAFTITDILLSDAGTNAFDILREGAEGIDAASRKAEELGINLSNLDATKLKEAAQAMGEANLAVEVAKERAAIESAPIVGELNRQYNESQGAFFSVLNSLMNGGRIRASDAMRLSGVNSNNTFLINQVRQIDRMVEQQQQTNGHLAEINAGQHSNRIPQNMSD